MWTKSYAAYVVARFLCMFSMQMLLLVLGLALYDLTGNPLHLGIAGLAMFLPALTLVFLTGLAADRLDSKLVVAVAFVIAATAIAVFVWLEAQGDVTPLAIFVLFGIAGTTRAFYNPALKVLLINIVPLDSVPRAIALNTTTAKAASITGPVTGGFLYALAPSHAYTAATMSFALAVAAVLMTRERVRTRNRTPPKVADLVGGISTILSNPILFSAMTLDLVAVILGGATALLPIYGRDILGVGAVEIGLLRAAPGLGTLVAAIMLVWRPLRNRAGLVMLSAMAGYGASILVFGLSHVYWLSFVALCTAGAFDMVSIFVREILIQLRTPDGMRGRVNAINSVFNSGANELGDFRAGSFAALIGAVPAVAVGGLCSIGIAAIWSWKYPELRRMDRP